MDISSMSSGSNNLINSSTATTSRKLSCKRKANSTEYLTCDDQPGCHKDVRRTHSQLEKRRRDKMNSFIAEMASLVPTCKTKSGKLDKLSVLRMAVQHMKTLQGSAANCCTEFHRKPAFLSDEQLKHLILRAADGFLFVVDCERGKILFVSESVHKILHYSQNELTGKSLFDYLHPKDISKIKEQLSSADTAPQETDISEKSGLSLKADINLGSLRFSTGVRRSFFCRMKCNRNAEDKTFSSTDRRSFCTIHSTGYLKIWPSTVVDLDENNEPDNDGCNLSCLVAVGRLHPHAVLQLLQNPIKIKPVEFVSRHAIDGKFVFVDQRATAVLAYLPQELLGTSLYEYLHEDDIAHLAECHRQVLQMREKINTSCYKLKIKDGSFITLRSCWFSFMNPWTKELECIVSTNTVVSSSAGSYLEPAASPQTIPRILIPGEGKPDFQTVPGTPGGTRVGAGKTGGMIAESFTVISEDQRVLEETVSSMVPAAVKNLLVEQAKNLCREKE